VGYYPKEKKFFFDPPALKDIQRIEAKHNQRCSKLRMTKHTTLQMLDEF
jgi:hypothetical protein